MPILMMTSDAIAHVVMCASVLMIVALTFERHFAICNPHKYRIHLRTTARWKHLAMYIAPVTAMSFFFNIPMFINLQVRTSELSGVIGKLNRLDQLTLSTVLNLTMKIGWLSWGLMGSKMTCIETHRPYNR